MSDISVRRVQPNATDAEIQRMTAVLADAFEGGTSSPYIIDGEVDGKDAADEFLNWMIGFDLELIPLFNECQIRMGLVGGEVHMPFIP
jgi:hypothetical protein